MHSFKRWFDNQLDLLKLNSFRDDAGTMLEDVWQTKGLPEYQKFMLGTAIGRCDIRKLEDYPKHWAISTAEQKRIRQYKAK